MINAVIAAAANIVHQRMNLLDAAGHHALGRLAFFVGLLGRDGGALGVGLAYALANAIFGGSAEYVALGLKSMGMENTFYWYVTAMMAVAFLFSLRLPKQAAYLHHDL